MTRRSIAWIVWVPAMLVWGCVCAIALIVLVGEWTQEKYHMFVLFLVFLAWVLYESYWWLLNAPWKLKAPTKGK